MPSHLSRSCPRLWVKKAKRETGAVTTAMRALAAPLTRVLAPPTRAYSRGARGRARIAAMNTTKTPPHDGDVEPWYPIGTPGVPWTKAQREEWRASVEAPKRSYADEVLAKLEPLKSRYDVFKYGALPYDADDPERYPLFAVRTRGSTRRTASRASSSPAGSTATRPAGCRARSGSWRPSARISWTTLTCSSPRASRRGGTNASSGGTRAPWTPIDPSPIDTPTRSKFLGAMVDAQGVGTWMVHVDLHETTDTDETEFRPAKAARTASTSPRTSSPTGSTPWATRRTRNPTFSARSSTRCPR